MIREKIHKWRWPLGIMLGLVIVALCCYSFSYTYYKAEELQNAKVRGEFYRTNLAATLERFQNLPYILSKDPHVVAGAEGIGLDELNQRLNDFAGRSGLEAIYLMSLSGQTISASNYNDPMTFLGQNYSFRSYFLTALRGDRGEIFAIGATTARPGYFVAEPVRNKSGAIIAVIALKVDLNSLTEVWTRGGETVFVTNQDQVVVLSSEKNWRYKTLTRLSEQQRQRIDSQRQFGEEKLIPLNWSVKDSSTVALDNTSYIFTALDAQKNGWTLYFLINSTRASNKAYLTSMVIIAILLSLILWQQFIKSQKIQSALKISQSARKKLHNTNLKLEKEITVRKTAEKHLEQMQKELSQARHLSSIGHVAASVTHELGQPISALKNIITTAEIDPASESVPNIIGRVTKVARRMENATEQLRLFSRPGNKKAIKISVSDLISGAVETIKPRLVSSKVRLLNQSSDQDKIFIKGNKLKLEQVLVNLLRNACDAVSDKADGQISVSTSVVEGMAHICVEDNGHGLKGIKPDKLFEPFHTTRVTGESMGLGLTISSEIVKQHDGQLWASDSEIEGAMFTIELPLWEY